jgi:hypothetical protein
MSEEINKLIKEHLIIKKEIEELSAKDETIKKELLFYLKELGVERFEDPEGNTVSYKEQSRETLDKNIIKEFITEEQYNSALKTTTFSSMKILSKESREKQKKFFEKND